MTEDKTEYIIDESTVNSYLSKDEKESLKFEVLILFLTKNKKRATILNSLADMIDKISNLGLRNKIKDITIRQSYFKEEDNDERKNLIILSKNCSTFSNDIIFITEKYLDKPFNIEIGKVTQVFSLNKFISSLEKIPEFSSYIAEYYFIKKYKEVNDTFFSAFRVA